MSENYFTITSTMLNDMKLSHGNLLVYAVIKSHSAGFFGSRQTLCNLTNLSLRAIDNALNYLLEKEYIRKEIYKTTNNQILNKYYDNYRNDIKVSLNSILAYLTNFNNEEFNALFIKDLVLSTNNTLILRFRGLNEETASDHLQACDKYYRRQLNFWNQQNNTKFGLKYEFYNATGESKFDFAKLQKVGA